MLKLTILILLCQLLTVWDYESVIEVNDYEPISPMYHVTSTGCCQHFEHVLVNTSPFVSPAVYQPSLDFADKWTQIFYCIKHARTVPLSIPLEFSKRTHVYLLLFLCGDISLNPGPVKNPCGICSKPVARNHVKLVTTGTISSALVSPRTNIYA